LKNRPRFEGKRVLKAFDARHREKDHFTSTPKISAKPDAAEPSHRLSAESSAAPQVAGNYRIVGKAGYLLRDVSVLQGHHRRLFAHALSCLSGGWEKNHASVRVAVVALALAGLLATPTHRAKDTRKNPGKELPARPGAKD